MSNIVIIILIIKIEGNDMEFNFSFSDSNIDDIYVPNALEFWAPIEERPALNESEMSSILNEGEVIESLHVALPSFLITSEEEGFAYSPCFELDRYFIIAKLKDSPYMIFYEEKRSSPRMQKLMKEGFLKNRSNYYLFDAFFDPFFGGITPKYYLFQRVSFETIPDAMILFRDLENEMPIENKIFMS